MDAIASPKSVSKRIDQLKARLQHLQVQEGQLTTQRRELLTGPQDLKTERELEQTETKLLVTLHQKQTAQDRLKALSELLPELKVEEAQARDRLKSLTKTAHEKLAEMEKTDQEILGQVQALVELLESRNQLAQEICDPITEGQYLALRFGLSGAVGDRTSAHPIGSVLMDRFRRLTLFQPTRPGAFTDLIHKLQHQRNRAAKAARQEQEVQRRLALAGQ